MRIRVSEVEKQRSCDCDCLHYNLVVESLAVVLTLVSGLAITGENLIVFNLITVPLTSRNVSNITSINDTAENRETVIMTENEHAMNILTKVFHYTSLAIAGLFFIEIVLKVCTIQKRFIFNPWQIFDSLIVTASLVLELTFHFVNLGQKGLYSLTYVILLRLWRIPMLCNIRANAALEASEYDLELYRNGRIKAEDRCRMLETTLSQQNESIKKLEKMLHDLTGSKQTDLAASDGHIKKNGHLPYKTYKTDDVLNVKNELPPSLSSDRQSYSLVVRSVHKQSKHTIASDTETEFMNIYDIESTSTLNRVSTDLPAALLYQEIAKESAVMCKNKEKDVSNSSNTVNSSKSDSDNVDRKSAAENKHVLCSENSTLATSSSPPPPRRSQIFLRSRKRRSSASEILDYINLSSPSIDSVFYDSSKNSTSTQNFDLEKDQLITKDIHENVCIDNDSNTNNNADTGEINPVSPEEKKIRQIKRRNRRFASCPEYVYTQRMNITNDESMLIGDGHATDHFGYSNLGFHYDENMFLPVVAEYDGTKTYRNQNGVPMTSL